MITGKLFREENEGSKGKKKVETKSSTKHRSTVLRNYYIKQQ